MTKNKSYAIEIAVNSKNEYSAIQKLKRLGINAESATLSDLDNQADLITIKTHITEEGMSDEFYEKIKNNPDIFILEDELSQERSEKIINISSVVERQLKKLLVFVLPETEKIFIELINPKQKIIPQTRIEWCRQIGNLTFSQTIAILEEDLSKKTREKLSSGDGLLQLISTSKNYEELRKTIDPLLKPKTLWDCVSSILDKPVVLNNILGALNYLCELRNRSAHPQIITAKDLSDAKKHQTHIMSHISKTKSSYRGNIEEAIKNLSKTLKIITESLSSIDYDYFSAYQKRMSELMKPITETISSSMQEYYNDQLPMLIKSISSSSNNQEKINQLSSLAAEAIKNSKPDWTNAMKEFKKLDDYVEIQQELSQKGIDGTITGYLEQTKSLKIELDKTIQKKKEIEDDAKDKLK